MPTKKQRIPTAIKIIAVLITPLLISAAMIYYFATELHNADQIYPHVKIAGIDVSGMTREEAAYTIGIADYDESFANVSVKFTFPDDSVLFIDANDVDMKHNANEMIYLAYSIGRGRGLVNDFATYLRHLDAEETDHEIIITLDQVKLNAIVNDFIQIYNEVLDTARPVIYEDRIVFTRGFGHVRADAAEVFERAYSGLFESLKSGEPVEMIYTLPEARNFGSEILQIRDSIFVQMVTSEYDRETIAATECKIGVDFDPIEAAWLIRSTETGRSATIPLVFTHPEYSQELLNSMLFRDLIGERTTFVHGTANRINNVRISSEAIHRMILQPGEEFSYNEVVGRRSADRGYTSAPALAGGESIPTIGGGVCQTSSTLYAAIKPSELLVTEQRGHSRSVPYLPRGWDATVVWNAVDFKFVNNTDFPLRINTKLVDRNLTIQIWGTIIDDFPISANWKEELELE